MIDPATEKVVERKSRRHPVQTTRAARLPTVSKPLSRWSILEFEKVMGLTDVD